MKQIEVAAGVITRKNEDGKTEVFCAQRPDRGENALKWEFPGGKLEPGETPQQALAREMREELSAEVSVGEFIMVVEHQYPLFKIILYAFFCTVASGSLKISEHVDFRWSVPDELPLLDWAAADRPVMNRINELKR